MFGIFLQYSKGKSPSIKFSTRN